MLNFVQRFFKMESASGILLLIFAFIAMLCANSSLQSAYFDFLDIPVAIQFGTFSINKNFIHWINDGFMAVFFVLVGMEVKREILEGSLSSYQQAIFPAFAAIGGMIIPAIIYWFITQQHAELSNGWAIPMATDIAFALGIVALLGKRVPFPLKVFLLALAIIDDLGAIVVIALFFSSDLSTLALTVSAIAIIGLIILNRLKVGYICAYLLVGLVLWASVLKSGVHATLAGVILGFCIPLKDKNGNTPLHTVEHFLVPWCYFFILPLFAFANAGVSLGNVNSNMILSALPVGISLGLFIGKPLGVFSFSYLSIKLGVAKLPEGVNLKQVFAIAVLCGIGFTMSMFLASLAFEGGVASTINTLSRLGVLLGSCSSAILGYGLLYLSTKSS
ncbi:Na+/H+ antiporter NhaA [Lonepinella koalarum]|uniref:Na(+)/H(+) antiporter NhaA n=1 Tax=Lonepinella koalarum TaxID=53417 RepID=A0A4R1KXF9_9PAST|nr:Na+/H+ antiporter NhaA [Lonepinella koalarum]MDH2927877.1 Na+/H+ antiporter NhaA [Lonepinella koalarum]TCK70072.1 sodium/proton antiporter (NhaA family) [Lonepinella koalarum]TFJ90331.1 Na+/H+ antiporter NhaA [Lonepinella koalarum]TYG35030.1 Na+/H+ antiporter NhaA [Lonepinella koalarum]